jgi:hypothetical protein
MQQPELNLTEPQSLSDADRVHLDTLVAFLATSKDWTTANDLLSNLCMGETESRKRWLRNLAANSDGQIISGQLGYRHILHSTPEEIHHAAAWLEHQADTMGQRARAIRRRAHSLIH